MPITFEQLPPSTDAGETTVNGSVSVDGYGLSIAPAAGNITIMGVVGIGGTARLDVDFGGVSPVLPALIDGMVFVSGFGALDSVVTSRLDVDGAVSVGGWAFSDSAIDGVVGISGEASAGGKYQGGFTFITEPQPVVACYVGHAFGAVRDLFGIGGASKRGYTSVSSSPLRLGTGLLSTYTGKVKAEEEFAFSDTTSFVVRMLAQSKLSFNALATGDYRLLARAASRLLLSGHAKSYAEGLQLIADALVFNDVAAWLQLVGVADTVALNARIDALYAAFVQVVERLVLATKAAPQFTLTVLLRDGFALGAHSSHEAELAAQLADAIGFAMSLSFDSGEFIAWVLNTESRGLTRYTQYPFNSFAKIGGRYYGAHTGGIARLGGSDDMGEPIKARLRIGMSDFGDRHLKSFSDAFFGMAASGQMLLKAIFVDERSGEKNMAIYKILPRPAGASRETRAKLGRGMKAVDWDFELENVDGTDFDLQSIQFYPTQLSRRTRG